MDLESFYFMSFLLIIVKEFPLAKLFTISLISFSLTSLDWTLSTLFCSSECHLKKQNKNKNNSMFNLDILEGALFRLLQT